MANRRTKWLGPAIGLAGVAAAAATWEVTRRRNLAELERDPDRDVLTAPLPGIGRTVESFDGTRLAVWEVGPLDGPIVVFSHGWGMGVRFWLHQLRDLCADHRVIAYDQRGHVASGKPANDDYSSEALGADLQAVLDACVPADRRALVVGHSMGGMSIIAWADAHEGPVTDRIHGAILADTGVNELTSTFFTELGVAKVVADTLGIRAFTSRLPLPHAPSPVSHRATSYIALGPDAPPSAVALTEQLFLDSPADVRSAIGMTISQLDLAHGVAKLTVPTTVVIGTEDKLTPPVHSQRLVESLPDGELVEFEGAGHQAPLERHHDFTKLVRQRAAQAPQ